MAEKLIDYNQIDLTGDQDVSMAQLEISIARELTAELVKHFPNRNWAIAVDSSNGMLAVMETDISQEKGYLIELSRSMNEIRGMMRAVGGEILERAGVPTGHRFNPDVMETLNRNARGEVIAPDLEAPEEKRARTKPTG